MKIQAVLSGAAALAALVLCAVPAQAATEMFNFADNADGIFAMGTFTVDNVANSNGTFDITAITGTVMNDSGPMPLADQIIGLVPNPGQPNPTVAFGFIYDNVTPLNTNGVLFQGQSSGIYNLWSNGGKAGELYTYGVASAPHFDAHGTLNAGAVPEPASWAMMLMGFGGLGALLRGRRQQGLAQV